MKVLLSVLGRYAELPSDTARIEEALNRLGMAVEATTVVGTPIPGVVTGTVLRTDTHPDAAKVTRVWVDAGEGVERHIWCGAKNMSAGDVVPVALPGTELPDGRTIGKRAILGIESEGMLCSGSEVGVPDDVDGLLILPPGTPAGRPLFEALGIEQDVVFDLDLTRNRPDCWGHLGVARDLAAHFGTSTRSVTPVTRRTEGTSTVSIDVRDPARCGMFSCARVSGIAVGPSPLPIKERLERLGMRSINNVVDASNLVMLELNQPNHAYDAALVSGFVIRTARAGEQLTTLDGVDRTLAPDDLLICDQNDAPIGMAGVMGGLESEVTSSTGEILLEIAWFDPDSVRFAANRHHLRSEASARFERGVDPEGAEAAVARFVEILGETCPSVTVVGALQRETTSGLPTRPAVALREATITRSLGRAPSATECSRMLDAIGFGCAGTDYPLTVTPPSYRPDCSEEIDLVEEIARHIGYDELGRRLSRGSGHGHLSGFQVRRRLLRQSLVGLGLDEAMPNPFLAPGDLGRCGLPEDVVLRIANPLVTEESVLRTSLRPGLLGAAAYNVSHRAPRIALWEIGHVYPPGQGQLPDESEWLCAMVVGSGAPEALRQWAAISDALGVGAQLRQDLVPAGLHPTRSATLSRGKTVIGHVGEIAPRVLRSFGIDQSVSLLELNLTIVLAEEPKVPMARALNRHPSSDIDLSFVVAPDLRAGDLHRVIRQAAGALAVSVDLIDSYSSSEVGRSLTFRVRLQKSDGTLSESEISLVRDAMVVAAQKSGAALRA